MIRTISCSAVGCRHIAAGKPCEDRCGVLTDNGVCSAVVADGAGAAKYDHAADGAECVVRTVTRFFCDNFDKFYDADDIEWLQKALTEVCRKALRKTAEELGVDSINRMASTLLSVSVKGDKVIVCHLGDGVIGRKFPGGAEILSEPENGEFAGSTYFVTTNDAAEHLRIQKGRVGDTESYFLMSDGVEEYLLDPSGQLNDAASKMADLVFERDGQTQLEKVIEDLMIQRDPASDDCTYVGIGIHYPKGVGSDAEDTGDVSAEYESAPEDLPSESEDHRKIGGRRKAVPLIIALALLILFVSCAVIFIAYRAHNTDNSNNTVPVEFSVSSQTAAATKPEVPVRPSAERTTAFSRSVPSAYETTTSLAAVISRTEPADKTESRAAESYSEKNNWPRRETNNVLQKMR